MNAAETIAAAIEKLEQLRQLSTSGEWEYDETPFGAIFTEQEPGLGVMTEVAEEMDEWDGSLIVTLHRTIGAQLDFLRYVGAVAGATIKGPVAETIIEFGEEFAHAILGGES